MRARHCTSTSRFGERARRAGPLLGVLAGALLALSIAPAARGESLGSVEPLTPWRKPLVVLPRPQTMDYLGLAQQGVSKAAAWRHDGWFCEYLGCSNGPYPLLTIWGEVPMFETADALQMADPSGSHRRLVEKFGLASERYWDRGLGGYAPYPGDRERNVQAFFDDNGWLGIAFAQAYESDQEQRWLRDAQRAFRFISTQGWDAAGGGGMWWNTSHPYHSGPALASDALLGMLLYGDDHESWQLEDSKEYIDWANANDDHDERQLYLEQADKPESVNDYVQAPLIYAQYLLCQDGEGQSYCEHASRVAATTAEQSVNATGYKFNYGPQYDALYMQWMMAYGKATEESYWVRLAEVNAVAASKNATSSDGLWLSSWWGGPIRDPETHPGMFRTAAATTSLFAWTGYYAGLNGTAARSSRIGGHRAHLRRRGRRRHS